MSDIEVQNITKKFGDFTAVDNVSFSVEHSEIFALLGPNGAGKSTLIRMLTTLIPVTSGSAKIYGHDVVKEADAVRRVIGVIPQAMTSDLELSVEENLLIYAKLYGVPRERRRKLMAELLEAVELTKWKDKPVKHLSGGMRRRVEIARGLVHEPRIFFLDEPTTGLDPVSRVAVWQMLQKIKRERDLTILLTTHYMDEADKLCDRIAIVDHGELKALDSPIKLKMSIPGKNTLEVSFSATPPGWIERVERLADVEGVNGTDGVFRIAMSLMMPIVQLVVLGYAFGGNVKHLKVAVVDQDHGVPAVRVRELASALSSGARTIDTFDYADQGQALADLRNGRVNGVLTIPPDFSRRVLAKNQPRLALIEDNTDNFVSVA